MAMISHSNENQVIEDNMGLVINVVKSFNPQTETLFDEYTQAGRIGLLYAARTPPNHCQWSTIAWNNIKWAILDYIEHEVDQNDVLPITAEPSGELHETIADYLPSTLLDRERDVINLRAKGCTFKDIGEIHGYSKSWANYVFHSGVQKIREANEIVI